MIARHELPTPGRAAARAALLAEQVPVITTEHCRLRGPVLSDFPACAEIACSDRGKFVGGPMSREDAWYEFTAMAAGWMLHGHGGWTIEDAKTSEVLGFVVLGLEPGDNEVELGYSLTAAAEGKGVATETARAVRDWAEAVLKLSGLVSYVDPDNARSIAVAKRLKATRDPAAEAEFDHPVLVYRHPSENSQ